MNYKNDFHLIELQLHYFTSFNWWVIPNFIEILYNRVWKMNASGAKPWQCLICSKVTILIVHYIFKNFTVHFYFISVICSCSSLKSAWNDSHCQREMLPMQNMFKGKSTKLYDLKKNEKICFLKYYYRHFWSGVLWRNTKWPFTLTTVLSNATFVERWQYSIGLIQYSLIR